jgi:hypothetical protein
VRDPSVEVIKKYIMEEHKGEVPADWKGYRKIDPII